MKLLIVGSDHVAAMEHHYRRYLTEGGIPNELFPAQGIFYNYYESSILNKILFKLQLSGIYRRINNELLRTADQFKPDILLVFKGMEIYPDTLSRLKEKGIKLVNYNPDNPFIFSGSGSGNKNVTRAVSLFDLYLTYDANIKLELQKLKVNAAIIPFGFEVTAEEVANCSEENEIRRICFLGNPDRHRCDFLNDLAKADLPVDVYGINWTRFRLDNRILKHGPVYGFEFWKVLRKYRVQLNLMRPHNLNSHNMRSIEVPAVGGIGLFPDTPDHRKFFENGKELFLYSDVQDCIIKARKLLSLSTEEAVTAPTSLRQFLANFASAWYCFSKSN